MTYNWFTSRFTINRQKIDNTEDFEVSASRWITPNSHA